MHLYLVRWQNLSVTLVRAYDEDDLMQRLDEVADPGAAKWWLYRGPLWVDLAPLVRFHVPDDARVGALRVDTIALEGLEKFDPDGGPSQFLSSSDEGGETRVEMLDAIMARAFPAVSEALGAFRDVNDDAALSAFVADVERAVRAELVPVAQYAWRAAKITDPALNLGGVTVELPFLRRQREAAASAPTSAADTDASRTSSAEHEPSARESERVDYLELSKALARRLARTRDALRRVSEARQGGSTPEHLAERMRGVAERALEDDDEADLNTADELGLGLAALAPVPGPYDAGDVDGEIPWPNDIVEDRLGARWMVTEPDADGLVKLELVRMPRPIAPTQLAARTWLLSEDELEDEPLSE